MWFYIIIIIIIIVITTIGFASSYISSQIAVRVLLQGSRLLYHRPSPLHDAYCEPATSV